MVRLTELREDGRWGVKGMDWMDIHEGARIKGKVMEILYGCLCELKAYEDTGYSPGEVQQMGEELNELNHCGQDQTKNLLEKLMWMRQENRWVPVQENNPRTSGDYLVTMIIPGYNQDQPVTNWLRWDNRDKVWTETNGDPITETVTAWKPIPEAYYEEDEGSD